MMMMLMQMRFWVTNRDWFAPGAFSLMEQIIRVSLCGRLLMRFSVSPALSSTHLQFWSSGFEVWDSGLEVKI